MYDVLTLGALPDLVTPHQQRLEARYGYEHEADAFPRPVDYDLPDESDLSTGGDFLGDLFGDGVNFAEQLLNVANPIAVPAGAAGDIFSELATQHPATNDPTGVGVPSPDDGPDATGTATSREEVDTGEGLFGKSGAIVAPSPIAKVADVVGHAGQGATSFLGTLLQGEVFGVSKKAIAAGAGLLALAVVLKRAKKKTTAGRRRRRR